VIAVSSRDPPRVAPASDRWPASSADAPGRPFDPALTVPCRGSRPDPRRRDREQRRRSL